MKKRFLYMCTTAACLIILLPAHPVFWWFFAGVGSFVISKWGVDKVDSWR